MHHDGLGVVLHGGGAASSGKPFESHSRMSIAGAKAELRLSCRDNLRNAAVLRKRQDADIEPFGFVVAEHLRCIKPADAPAADTSQAEAEPA